MGDLYLIFKNMTRNKLRFSLNWFCIFVAFFLFGMLSAFGGIFDAAVQFSQGRLMVVNKVNLMQPLPYAYVDKVRAVNGVKNVSHMGWFAAYYQNEYTPIKALVVDPQSYMDIYPELLVSEVQKQDWYSQRNGLMVGKNIAESRGWQVGDRIPLGSPVFAGRLNGNTVEMVVSGIFEGEDARTDTNRILVHYRFFNEGQSFQKDQVSIIIVETEEEQSGEAVIRAIDEQFENSFAETSTSTEEQFTTSLINQIADIGMILSVVLSAAFFTILLIVGNMFALSIRERKKEIAVMKVLGFPAPRIFKMVLSESIIVSLFGGLTGLLVAWLVLEKINSLPELKSVMPAMLLTGPMILQGIAIMVLLGLVAGFLPSLRAIKVNTVSVLSGD